MLEVSTAPGGPLGLTGAPELRGSPVRDTLCYALLSLLSLTSLAHHCGREEPRDPLSREFWDHIYSQARPVKGAATGLWWEPESPVFCLPCPSLGAVLV